MKTLALLILLVGFCAFVSAEDDYEFNVDELDEEFDEKYEDAKKRKVN